MPLSVTALFTHRPNNDSRSIHLDEHYHCSCHCKIYQTAHQPLTRNRLLARKFVGCLVSLSVRIGRLIYASVPWVRGWTGNLGENLFLRLKCYKLIFDQSHPFRDQCTYHWSNRGTGLFTSIHPDEYPIVNDWCGWLQVFIATNRQWDCLWKGLYIPFHNTTLFTIKPCPNRQDLDDRIFMNARKGSHVS